MRYLVLEGHAPAAVAAAARQLAGPGAQLVQGWRRPVAGVHLLCVGRVATEADAAAAVMCAVSGSQVVVDAIAPREVIDRLCDDLRRLGELEHRVGAPTGGGAVGLPPDQQALLALLLSGASLGQAARELHLSRRTADRRLAAARQSLGVATTSEALAAAARLGLSAQRSSRP